MSITVNPRSHFSKIFVKFSEIKIKRGTGALKGGKHGRRGLLEGLDDLLGVGIAHDLLNHIVELLYRFKHFRFTRNQQM